ncbi:MAG TPA: response regulator, partial [Aggregatilineales bacterium]|nr:response regulator [Aggregatilineales bacterium]
MAHLLIVEANSRRAESMQWMLDFAMYEADFVPDGDSAIHYLKQNLLPDALIANVVTPGVDGFHLCRKIRQTPEFARLPVILITEQDSAAGIENLVRRAGAAGLIERPLQRDQFLSEVDRAILMSSVQDNPLAKASALEETAFLRDYNAWLSQMAHQAIHKLENVSAE